MKLCSIETSLRRDTCRMMGAPDCSAYAIGTAQAYNAPMFGSRFVHRSMHSVWRTLMCLALFAFMLRAMVQAGFMPDPGALQNGRFGVAFCSADCATEHRTEGHKAELPS